MDMGMESWISELEMDEYFIDECIIPCGELDEYVQLVSSPEENFPQSSFVESQSCGTMSDNKLGSAASTTTATATCGGLSVEICRTSFERPHKLLKNAITPNAGISIEESNENMHSSLCDGDTNKGNKNNSSPKAGQKRSNNGMARTSVEAQDRVLAERKRREKLSQRFIALSAMVPGLKKMDKASVLGDAINYLKQLQENVKTLEEKINMKSSEESLVFVKKSQVCLDDDMSSSDEKFDGHFKEALPQIEARISEKSVLIRIHCEKQKGFAVKLLSEIEKLHLTVVNTSFLPFGQYAMDITVVAQMEAEFSMTVKTLVKVLRSTYMKFV